MTLLLVLEVAVDGLGLRRAHNYPYPQAAVEWLKQREFSGNLLSLYGWGGYLIWNYPEKKVFIDGRMDTWRWNSPPPGESAQALADYMKIAAGDGVPELLDKYRVSVVLWMNSDVTQNKIELMKFVVFSWKSPRDPLLEKLEQMGWKKVYEDQTAVIYSREEMK